MYQYFLVLSIILFFVQGISAQESPRIFINEFLASNVTIDADIVDFDDYSDWIELYNDEDVEVDIIGYFITDDLTDPYKWQFTTTTIIPAKGFLRVWADGVDKINGEYVYPGRHFTRPYRDQDNNLIYFETNYYHLNFKLSRAGETIGLIGTDSTLVDSVTYGLQYRDVSMGRQPDGAENWFFFGEPTAGKSNTTQGLEFVVFSETPQVSPGSGFYSESQLVTLSSSTPEGVIRYTLNGSKPSSSSTLYESPVLIDGNSVIRARVFENGKLPGPVATKTYFINEEISLPVISISSPPDVLFDDQIGIYDNIFKGREIPINFEFFETGGIPAFNLDAGLRLTGQASIFYAQKSFTISARELYGTDAITYQIFPDREIDTYTSLYLRNAGFPDNQSTFIREALIQSLALHKIDIDGQAYRPAIVFLNGQYWGIYNMRDKINTDYLGSIHNLNPDDIDLLEYNSLPYPEEMAGQRDNYLSFYDFIQNHNLSLNDNYEFISNWMDIDEYINYQICEIYADNIVWLSQNVRMWRERREGEKWRWILFDTDYGFGMPSTLGNGFTNNTLQFATNTESNVQPPPWSTLMFRKLLENEDFKTKFLQKYLVYLNTIFYPDSVLSLIDQYQNGISSEIPRHISRWRNDTYQVPLQSYSEWVLNISIMRNFATNRPQYAQQHLADYFGYDPSMLLYIDVNDQNMGTINVNGYKWLHLGYDSDYFINLPLDLEAIPNVGYRFVRWEGIPNELENPVTVISSEDLLEITAIFEPVPINLIPSQIVSDTILTEDISPYYSSGDITINSSTKMQIDEGVQLIMSEDASIVVYGGLQINGSSDNPVIIRPNDNAQNWGAICFVNASDSSVISNLKIIGATNGIDFSRDKAAISGYNSRFSLNQTHIEDSQAPVFVQYGKVAIKNSYLQSDYAGDLINIKYTDAALVENCVLKGNDKFDSDGIDYDQITGGVIRGNRIYNFYGFNSDAIDLGESSEDILIENNIIYNINDKAVSIGHGSTAEIKRNLIANCGQGVGIKDENSYGYIEHCTFYTNRYGFACFEKNIGVGGGTAEAVNCIIADSKNASVFVDPFSSLDISYSLSNTNVLLGLHNIYGDPDFLNNLFPGENSPAVNSGNPVLPLDPDGSLPDMGVYPYNPDHKNLIINEIHYHPPEGEGYQFIELINTGESVIDLSDMRISGDISFVFPAETMQPGEIIIVAKNSAVYQGGGYTVYQWNDSTLKNISGEILLTSDDSTLIDFINYDGKPWWPDAPDGRGPSLELHHPSLENMVSVNWRESYSVGGTPGQSNNSVVVDGLFINEILASNSTVNSDKFGEYDDWLEIYNNSQLPVNTGGLYLTDDFSDPCKYQIPWISSDTTTIPSGGHLLFWSDGQPEQGILHTNFRLSRDGEQIGLVQVLDNDTLFLDSLTFKVQETDISFGRYPDGSDLWQSFHLPTPGDSNYIVSNITKEPDLPRTFSLSQNFPNPFNPETMIRYQLPRISNVELNIYNILGQKLVNLVNEQQQAGRYQVEWNASGVSTGIYFYRLKTDKYVKIRKMILMK